MRRLTLPLVLAASILPTAAVSAAQVQVTTSEPIVELTVTESVEAEPDLVTIGAGVTSEAPTAVEAMRVNARAMDAVVQRLRQIGVPARDIQTSGISLGARYDYNRPDGGAPLFAGYQASNRVSVRLREVARTGAVLDTLVAAGATDLSGPGFGVADERAARSQARGAAVAALREQALAYARMAGFSDIRLLRLEEGPAAGPPRPMMREAAQAASDVATPVQPGVVEIGVTLSATYALVP